MDNGEMRFYWVCIAMGLPKVRSYFTSSPRSYEEAFKNLSLVVESMERFYKGLQELDPWIREDYDEPLVMMIREVFGIIEQIQCTQVREVFRREFNSRVYKLYSLI